jgi:formate-dependent nitrite reductase cytochrome c552 subunit
MKKLVMLAALAASIVSISSFGNDQCLTCHSFEGLKKVLNDGSSLSLYINREEFENSVHAPLGCVTCHSENSAGADHPKQKSIEDHRSYAIERVEKSCRMCHADKFDLQDTTIHPTIPDAMICTDCHGTHNIKRTPETAQQDAILNILLGMAFLGGLMVPVGHSVMGFIIKRK